MLLVTFSLIFTG